MKEINLIDVMLFAQEKHKKQEYRGQSYFHGHLIHVANECKKYTNDKNVIAAALLHDVIEDTDVTQEELSDKYNPTVAKLVWRVTDEAGANRKEKKTKTYPKIRENDNAVLIKLCDRLVNMTASTKIDMYRKEYPEFKKALYKRGVWEDLWNKLDKLVYGTN